MRLTFLGTGSAMPTGPRAQSGLLLEADGTTLLVDCGDGPQPWSAGEVTVRAQQ